MQVRDFENWFLWQLWANVFNFFFSLISFDVIVFLFQFVVAMRIVISFRQFTVPTYSLSLVRL